MTPLVRFGVQGTAIAVLLWNVARMMWTPIFWPFAAVLLMEAVWLGFSLRKTPRRVDTTGSAVLASSGIAVYPVLIAWIVPGPYIEPTWRFAVSYGVQLAALVLELWALLSLRDTLTQLPEAHGVIQTGPYRYVRHPLYVAYIVAFFGSCIGVWRVSLWILFAVFVILEWLRARAEERVLSKTFSAYRSYQTQTGMFVPRWRTLREVLRGV
ncbi:methyltransferase family protein [Alicyclobacillus acidocaldarius]|uniref:Isoprenylcysteine carboxyl methyltransferase n=1 Tax=Alicyclobacillus acidocaldarius subsp. acidocaldarius (strain ATCC 27009 / DSM 446 / BCRC 14685 / JCM 5260 / KCTC 1825 / NBRC 15652 / NCIMB 11725 / NRRL B-14509 / 104-IA) TaxID=521098 RepID=C8WVU1_ALIAD|nr:methyltransferase [Alicyclobacillus acidocaldarius]ACV58213.1 Isoprenylcysteine carboxyl methyltransferase [Alicyclobacillus acidocaldarius subsp. acidocaldarius DSM 446]